MINVFMAANYGIEEELEKVRSLCMERIANAETISLICENENQRMRLLNKLNISHLSELVLNPNDNSYEQVITTFEADRSYDDLSTMIRFSNLDDELNDIVKAHRRQVFGNMSWSQLNQRALHARYQYSPNFLTNQVNNESFDFNHKEYYLLRGRVDHFSKIFTSKFIVEERQNIFSDSIFQFSNLEQALLDLSNKLDNFFIETQNLVNSFIGSLGDLRKDFQKSRDTEIHDLMLNLDRLIQDISFQRIRHIHADSASSFSFRKKKNDIQHTLPIHLQEEWEEIQTQLLKASLTNKLSTLNSKLGNEIYQHAIQWKDTLENQEKTDEAYNLYLRQLNIKQNANSDYFLNLEKELQDLIDQINKSKVFNTNIENNSISTLKKFQLVKRIQEMILVAKYQIINHKKYFQWKSDLINLDTRVNHVVGILGRIDPKDWVKAFDSWYLTRLVQKFRPFQIQLWDAYYKEWASLLSQTGLDKNESLTAKAIVERIKSTMHLMDDDPSMFKKIFIDKSYADIDSNKWHYLLKKYFPIQLYVVGEVYDSTDAILLSEVLDSVPKSKLGDRGWIEVKLLNKAKKLQHARVLAEAIYYNTREINMYIGSSKKYLFSVSNWKKDHLLSILKHESLKKIELNEEPLNALIEFFLLSMPTTYVYEEFLCELVFPDFLQRNLMMEKLLIMSDIRLYPLNDSTTMDTLTADSL